MKKNILVLQQELNMNHKDLQTYRETCGLYFEHHIIQIVASVFLSQRFIIQGCADVFLDTG